jgi:hypothetical protein
METCLSSYYLTTDHVIMSQYELDQDMPNDGILQTQCSTSKLRNFLTSYLPMKCIKNKLYPALYSHTVKADVKGYQIYMGFLTSSQCIECGNCKSAKYKKQYSRSLHLTGSKT